MKTLCLACGKPLQGRSDKKFCDDHCRVDYHRQQQAPVIRMIKSVHSVLQQNRKILEWLCPGDHATVHIQHLKAQGFNFTYFTSVVALTNGSDYRFCYDYGYALGTDDYVQIIKSTRKKGKTIEMPK